MTRLLRGGAAMATVNFLDLIAGVLTATLIARYLGASGLGMFSLLMAVYLTANTVVDLGASALLTREVALEQDGAKTRLKEHLKLKLVLLGIVSLLLLVVANILGHFDKEAGKLLSFGLPFLVLSAINISTAAALRGVGKLRPLVLAALPAFLFQTLGVWGALRGGRGLGIVLLLMGVAQGLRVLAAWAPFLNAPSSFQPANERGTWELFRSALPFAGVVLIGVAYLKADIYLLSAMAGPAATGLYAAASRIIDFIKLLPGAFLSVVYPRLVRRDLTRLELKRLYWVLALSASVCALGLIVTAPWLISTLYGTALAPAELPLRLLALALVPAVLNNAQLLELYAKSEEAVVARVVGVGLGLNVGLNLVLVPVAGASGAAIALVASEWLVFTLYRRSLAGPAETCRSLPVAAEYQQS